MVAPAWISARRVFPAEMTALASPLVYELMAESRALTSLVILEMTGVRVVSWAAAPVTKAMVENLIVKVVGGFSG